jgi:hypothetical protein
VKSVIEHCPGRQCSGLETQHCKINKWNKGKRRCLGDNEQENDGFKVDWGLNSGVWTQGFTLAKQVLYCLSHASSPSCSRYFGDGVSQTVCPDWPQTEILRSQPPK